MSSDTAIAAFQQHAADRRKELDRETARDANLAKKAGKRGVHLAPPALLIGAARAYEEGAVKYGPFSWRKPEVKVSAREYAAPIIRHALAFLDGEDVDPDSTTGKLHLEGIAATVGILLDVYYSGKMVDDRVGGPAPGLLRAQ